MSLVSKSSKILIKDLKGVNMGLFSITTNGRLLSNSFATARSKMLLFSFAAGLVSKALVGQVKKFGIQQESVQRLASVYGGEGAESLAAYASELQKVTTFGDESINVAMAQMGAFGASVEQTKTLTKATLDLSAGMGIDLNTAALLVAKSFGTSTNALGRYGVELDSNMTKQEKVAAITAKVEERYGGLAKQLASTTSGQLKQANNALGDMAEVFGRAIAPMVLIAAKALKSFAEAVNIKVMRFFVASLTAIGATFAAIAVSSKVAAAGQAIYTGALALTSAATTALTAKTITLRAALISTGVGALVVGLGALVAVMMNMMAKYDEANFVLDENTGKTRRLTEEEIRLRKAQADSEKALIKKLAILEATTEAEKEAARQGRELRHVDIGLMLDIQNVLAAQELKKETLDAINSAYNDTLDARIANNEALILESQFLFMTGALTEEQVAGLDKLIAKQKELVKQRDEGTSSESKILASMKDASDVFNEKFKEVDGEIVQTKKLTETQKLNLKIKQQGLDIQSAEIIAAQELAASMDNITAKMKEQNEEMEVKAELKQQGEEMLREASAAFIDRQKEEADSEIQKISDVENKDLEAMRQTWAYKSASDAAKQKMEEKIRNKADKDRKKVKDKANKEMLKAFRLEQLLNLRTAIMNTAEAVTKAAPNIPLQVATAAMGAAQIAMIASQKPPKMATGGIIGGQRHAQGGTMINAEQGEYVVSRAGVESVGIETLNRINSGQGAASQSIVINNPMLGKDTIEDEIIPQIQEALRRGYSLDA